MIKDFIIALNPEQRKLLTEILNSAQSNELRIALSHNTGEPTILNSGVVPPNTGFFPGEKLKGLQRALAPENSPVARNLYSAFKWWTECEARGITEHDVVILEITLGSIIREAHETHSSRDA